jgi:hypothetical protein
MEPIPTHIGDMKPRLTKVTLVPLRKFFLTRYGVEGEVVTLQAQNL